MSQNSRSKIARQGDLEAALAVYQYPLGGYINSQCVCVKRGGGCAEICDSDGAVQCHILCAAAACASCGCLSYIVSQVVCAIRHCLNPVNVSQCP